MKKILTIILITIGLKGFAQNTVNVNASNTGLVTTTYVTEQKNYYNGEFYWQHGLNTTTGAITSVSNTDIADYLPIDPSTSITMYASDSTNIYVYGWTYDINKNPIAEIRNNALISSPLKTYTFTTPSNAAYLTVYTKYASDSFNIKLRIKSTNQITYQSPILPSNFTGANQSIQLQNALNFQRFTSSNVSLSGTYYLDSNIILSSGNRIVMNNALIKTRNTSLYLSLSNSKQINSGNSNISITGIGTFYNSGFRFTDLSNFLFSGININSSYAFAFLFIQCRYGIIRDIWFNDGIEMSNQDGIHLLAACHAISIENIYGMTGDDMIGIVNDILECGTPILYEPYAKNGDIYDISIKGIHRNLFSSLIPFGGFTNGAKVYRSSIRLLTEDGYKIHDIRIDNIDGDPEIQLQDSTHYYATTSHSTRNDMYNISLSNINSVIYVWVPIKNSSFVNVPSWDVTGTYQSVYLPDSSLNIYRQYYGFAPVFIDSVTTGGVIHSRTLN